MYSLCGIYKSGFISGIKVYAYAYEHGPKREMVLPPDHQLLQEIIIQDAVVDALTGSPFTINIFVLL